MVVYDVLTHACVSIVYHGVCVDMLSSNFIDAATTREVSGPWNESKVGILDVPPVRSVRKNVDFSSRTYSVLECPKYRDGVTQELVRKLECNLKRKWGL